MTINGAIAICSSICQRCSTGARERNRAARKNPQCGKTSPRTTREMLDPVSLGGPCWKRDRCLRVSLYRSEQTSMFMDGKRWECERERSKIAHSGALTHFKTPRRTNTTCQRVRDAMQSSKEYRENFTMLSGERR